MKKKMVTLCLVVALVLTAVIGGTMAYFTDTDNATNSFTVGNVDITLEEDFGNETDKEGVKDTELMPGKVIKKEAWIKNEGPNEAWVWAEVLIPTILDDGIKNSITVPPAPGLENSLHVNFPGAFSVEYAQSTDATAKFYNAEMNKLWIHESNEAGLTEGYKGRTEIDGVTYNVYVKLYTEKVAAEAVTSNFLSQVYMDKKVKQCTKENCACNGNGYILYDGVTCYTGDWEVLVYAYGMQTEGFETVVDAYKAYDGAGLTMLP